mmetsp:Transcript_31071/g.99695  ORF Transcript_31071/g.99695 Transcript_31071/m.99695 type:complete len:222 (+) Transcript_31071:650-1315(+)
MPPVDELVLNDCKEGPKDSTASCQQAVKPSLGINIVATHFHLHSLLDALGGDAMHLYHALREVGSCILAILQARSSLVGRLPSILIFILPFLGFCGAVRAQGLAALHVRHQIAQRLAADEVFKDREPPLDLRKNLRGARIGYGRPLRIRLCRRGFCTRSMYSAGSLHLLQRCEGRDGMHSAVAAPIIFKRGIIQVMRGCLCPLQRRVLLRLSTSCHLHQSL